MTRKAEKTGIVIGFGPYLAQALQKRGMSASEAARRLGYKSRNSIFRVLELFAEKDVVHVIEDGSRALKYELCHASGDHSPADQHVHFYCERCHETYCLEDVPIPPVAIPDGFTAHSVNYMIKGLCPTCSRRS